MEKWDRASTQDLFKGLELLNQLSRLFEYFVLRIASRPVRNRLGLIEE